MHTHVNSQGKKRREKSSGLSLFLKVNRGRWSDTGWSKRVQRQLGKLGLERAWNEQRCRRCESKSPTGVSIRDAVKISWLIRRCQTMSAPIGKHSQTKRDALRKLMFHELMYISDHLFRRRRVAGRRANTNSNYELANMFRNAIFLLFVASATVGVVTFSAHWPILVASA